METHGNNFLTVFSAVSLNAIPFSPAASNMQIISVTFIRKRIWITSSRFVNVVVSFIYYLDYHE